MTWKLFHWKIELQLKQKNSLDNWTRYCSQTQQVNEKKKKRNTLGHFQNLLWRDGSAQGDAQQSNVVKKKWNASDLIKTLIQKTSHYVPYTLFPRLRQKSVPLSFRFCQLFRCLTCIYKFKSTCKILQVWLKIGCPLLYLRFPQQKTWIFFCFFVSIIRREVHCPWLKKKTT